MPSVLQALAALAEFGGGIALILGLLTPLAAFAVVCQMLGALFLVHFPKGDPFVAAAPGAPSYELALVYLAAGAPLIALGPGRWSLDALLFDGRRTREPQPNRQASPAEGG